MPLDRTLNTLKIAALVLNAFLIGAAVGMLVSSRFDSVPVYTGPHRVIHVSDHVIPTAKETEYLYCQDLDGEKFSVSANNVLLVIANAQPSDEIKGGAVGLPVGVLMLDSKHVAHLYTTRLPKCYRSNGVTS